MFDWLIDDAAPIYLVLGVVAIGLLVALWVTRKRHWAFALGGVVVLGLLVFLLTLLFPTDQSKILGSIHEMRAAVQRHDADGVMKHIAKDFQFQGVDRSRFQSSVQHVLRERVVDDVNVWEFDEIKIDRPNKTASLAFKAKPSPPQSGKEVEHYLIRATFVLDADDQWRMKTFQVFNPFVETDKPMTVPLPQR
jgi:hypothetical protein